MGATYVAVSTMFYSAVYSMSWLFAICATLLSICAVFILNFWKNSTSFINCFMQPHNYQSCKRYSSQLYVGKWYYVTTFTWLYTVSSIVHFYRELSLVWHHKLILEVTWTGRCKSPNCIVLGSLLQACWLDSSSKCIEIETTLVFDTRATANALWTLKPTKKI